MKSRLEEERAKAAADKAAERKERRESLNKQAAELEASRASTPTDS